MTKAHMHGGYAVSSVYDWISPDKERDDNPEIENPILPLTRREQIVGLGQLVLSQNEKIAQMSDKIERLETRLKTYKAFKGGK